MFLPRKKPNRLVIQLNGNYGKVLSVINSSDTKQKQKLITILFKPVHKVVLVFRRLMAKYAYREGAVTPILQDIIDHAKQSKENSNSGSYLSNASLGALVHDVWLGSIQKVKRGPRKNNRMFIKIWN